MIPLSSAITSALIERLQTVIAQSCAGADNKNYSLHGLSIAEGEQLLQALTAKEATIAAKDAELATLRKEHAVLRLALAEEGGFLRREQKRVEAAEASVQRLRDYAAHKPDCGRSDDFAGLRYRDGKRVLCDCTCGLDAALAALPGDRPTEPV